MDILGIDIGGSGIKGAPVNIDTGEMLAPRQRIPTPQPPKPEPMAEVVAQVARYFAWDGPIGCGFPAVIRNGVAYTAANVSKKWIGTDAASLFSAATGCPVCMVNDADAAGLAEMTFGAGRGRMGMVLIVTVGTGIGTALFTDGHLVRNTELGHIELQGQDAETFASDAARKRDNLTLKKWAKRFNLYLNMLEKVLWPDLIILGGGVSKEFDVFRSEINVQAEIVPARMLNEAGIIGAALATKSCAPEN